MIYVKLIIILLFGLIHSTAHTATKPLISYPHDCKFAAAAGEGKNLYLAWIDNRENDPDLYFRASYDEGISWTKDIKVNRNEDAFCYPPAIIADGTAVHLCWIDFGDEIDGEVRYSRSFDNGATWEEERILIEDANSARFPVLAIEDRNIYLVYQDVKDNIYFKASYNNGDTWEDKLFITQLNFHSCFCYPPAVTIDGTKVLLAYADFIEKKSKSISNIAFVSSNDYGKTWGKETIIVKSTVKGKSYGEISNPSMISSGPGSYHLFWIDKKKWNKEVRLSKEKKSPKRISVICDTKDGIHMAWSGFLGGLSTIFYKKGLINGKHWDKTVKLTSHKSRCHDPVIAKTSSGILHIFWFDEIEDDNSRIYYKRSTDSGDSWCDWDYFIGNMETKK
jgi:hypothetical protein